MLNTTRRLLTIGLAAGTLTMLGAPGAFAAAAGPGPGQRATVGPRADDGGGPNPLCMVRPQDCMYPPGNGSGGGSGNGNGNGSGGGSGGQPGGGGSGAPRG